MIKTKIIINVIAVFLILNSSAVTASLYDIICVECTLKSAQYEFNDATIGQIASGDITVPGVSSDFQIDNFFGYQLTAHNVNFYRGEGTYSFDSIGDSVTPGQSISMTVGANQIGMHFLFDWHDNTDIDVLNVFDISYLDGDMILTSTDVDVNGIIGFSMVDGPFQGADIATHFLVATPIPAAAWLFVSGLIALFGVARRKFHHNNGLLLD